ncbi:MAG: hypothetical protein AAF399_12280 [Bacteroidota bacterium]
MNSKLFLGLRSLQVEEYPRWEAFLHSSYHTTHGNSPSCWEYLKAYAPEFSTDLIQLEALHTFLFPDRTFHRQRVLDEISHLYQSLKRFWEMEALRQDPLLQRTLRLRQISERKLDRIYSVERKAAQRMLEEEHAQQEVFYQTQLAWTTIDNEHFGRQQLRTVDESLSNKLQALDLFYLVQMLRESCEALNRQHILNTQYEIVLLPAILELLNQLTHPYRRIPLVAVYLQIYQSLQASASDETYECLLATLREYRAHFSRQEQRAMYKFAQNFCIRKINEGQGAYDHRLFDLFREVLAEGILFTDGNLSHTDCKNITTIGLRVKELDWVERFLGESGHKVDLEFRENVLAYCRASLEAERGHPQKAIRLLSQISHTDVHYQLSARQLLLKIYYYEEDIEGVLYTIDSFRHFLQRNKEIPKSRRDYHLRFLNLFKRLSLLRERVSTYSPTKAQEQIRQLRERLIASDSLANRGWLEEEITALQVDTPILESLY